MSLILEGLSLVLEAGGLAMDCACCIKEKCEAIACVKDIDCDEAGKTPDAECFCRKKSCTSNPACQGDEDCPDGQECVDGVCVSKCRGQPCSADGDCPEECVCLEGGCWNKENVYYCHGDPNDSNADGECKEGVPQVSKGGPYLTYGLCAQSGCKSKFSCNPVVCDCYPDAAGTYEDLVSCQQECCGGSGDLGRCCESRVTYDVNGDVTNVVQGQSQPCCSLGNCTKDQCISDKLEDVLPYPTTRVFRQFNSLFSNCDLCPTVDIGPCCYEKDGVPTCGMHDRGECENVLDGEWKGNNWFDCENARDPDVDLLIDFACPGCNGGGDCSCGGNGYCYGQKCRDCNNPATVNHLSHVIIDTDPKIGDKWKFRSRDCNGGVSTQNQSIDIYGEKNDGTMVWLTTVDNSSPNSIGLTEWTLDSAECFWRLTARKMIGDPDEAQLCAERTAAGDPLPPVGCRPIQVGTEGQCDCPGGPDCSGDDESLANASYSWQPNNIQVPAGLIYKNAECFNQYKTEWWIETTSQNLMIETSQTDGDGFPCLQGKSSGFTYFRLLAYLPGTGWTDVTDDWVDSTTNVTPEAIEAGYNDLLRYEYYYEDEQPFDPETCEPSGFIEQEGSEGVYQELYDIGCEKPDPLSDCGNSNFSSENPLP